MFHYFKVKPADLAIAALLLVLAALLFPYVRQRGQPDFMPFYLGGKLAAAGQIARIYDTSAYQPLIEQMRLEGERMSPFDANYFIRPAFEAFLYVPFSWLSYRNASLLALIGNIGLLGILVWKLPVWLGVRMPRRPAIRFGLAIFYPFIWSIVLGQDTLLLTLLIGYALSPGVILRSGKAGILLGLCVWKPNLTWIIPFALMAAGRWRMAFFDLATSSLLLALSFALVGVKGFRQWVVLVQAPSSDITPSVMGNIRALSLHFGLAPSAIALLVIIVCCYFVVRHGTIFDKVSAALLAGLLISPHTYLQDYSLVAIVALLETNPMGGILLLLPWPWLYPRKDILPLVFAALFYLVFLGVKHTFVTERDLEKPFGLREIGSRPCG